MGPFTWGRLHGAVCLGPFAWGRPPAFSSLLEDGLAGNRNLDNDLAMPCWPHSSPPGWLPSAVVACRDGTETRKQKNRLAGGSLAQISTMNKFLA
jgi:hypothetical protein